MIPLNDSIIRSLTGSELDTRIAWLIPSEFERQIEIRIHIIRAEKRIGTWTMNADDAVIIHIEGRIATDLRPPLKIMTIEKRFRSLHTGRQWKQQTRCQQPERTRATFSCSIHRRENTGGPAKNEKRPRQDAKAVSERGGRDSNPQPLDRQSRTLTN